MLDFEKDYYSDEINLIAGADEAGRGPLAGPLVVAACILPKDFNHELIMDSKKLTEKKREQAFEIIKENAVAFYIEIISVEEIDNLNIYQASKQGMITCFSKLAAKPQLFLTDAMPISTLDVETIDIIKGDSKSKNIAAASILAKVTRDRIMVELDKKYPQYGFKNHKGYGTKKHIEAIKEFGIIEGIHRLTYEPCKTIFRKISLF